MASAAQVAANRRNAQKSTGPRTEAGKATSARNALRHGLTAEALVIYDEREEDFCAFHAEMAAALAPRDAIAAQLAERVILCAWRLRRASRAEAAVMNDGRHQKVRMTSTLLEISGGVIDDKRLTALARYEMGLERAFHRALAAFERWQAQRPRVDEKDETKPNLLSARSGESSARGGGEESDEAVIADQNDKTKPNLLSARGGERKGPAPQASEGEVSGRDAEAATETPPPHPGFAVPGEGDESPALARSATENDETNPISSSPPQLV